MPKHLLVLLGLLSLGVLADQPLCPIDDYYLASYTQVAMSGEELVVNMHGYGLTKLVIAKGPPPAQRNAACFIPVSFSHPDPAAPCDTVMTSSTLMDDLIRCPDVAVSPVDGGSVMEFKMPVHALSRVQTGVDPNGEPIFGNRYRNMEIVVHRTLSLGVYTMFSVRYT
ncbi:hypothetical protein PAPYR_8263 [Paratrimastix pyriformis]|uniref:Uncharacterized protein n=1 Tax=Paratrimastix pyriformis TaxID=342808 RepID=A0ABQ8UB52_9EUKA|nr:hypothetical protein PAPYR_8263 [Paratrimastix pyriformis]